MESYWEPFKITEGRAGESKGDGRERGGRTPERARSPQEAQLPQEGFGFQSWEEAAQNSRSLALGKENATIKQYMRRKKINCIYILAFISKHSTKQS